MNLKSENETIINIRRCVSA